MIRVTPIQTGTVSIRPHHHCGEESEGPDATWDLRREPLSEDQAVEFCMLVGHTSWAPGRSTRSDCASNRAT